MKTVILKKDKVRLPFEGAFNSCKLTSSGALDLWQNGRGRRILKAGTFTIEDIPDFGEWDEVSGYERLNAYSQLYGDSCALAALPQNASCWRLAVLGVAQSPHTPSAADLQWFQDTFGGSAFDYCSSLMFMGGRRFVFDLPKFDESCLKTPAGQSTRERLISKYGPEVAERFERVFIKQPTQD